ncbi:MAG: hypothetical protein L7U87_08695 [Chlamydiales bacterium]|nr:hypothetical protein [Chlamydiales bacterium]
MSSKVAAFHTGLSRNLQQQNFQKNREYMLRYTSKIPGISSLSQEKQLAATAAIAVCALVSLASLTVRSIITIKQRNIIEAFIKQSEHIKKLKRVQSNCAIQGKGEPLPEGCSLPQRDHEQDRIALASLVLFEDAGKDKASCLAEVKKLQLQVTTLKTLKIAIEGLPECLSDKSKMLKSVSNLDQYALVLSGIEKYLTQKQDEVTRLELEKTLSLLKEESDTLNTAFTSSLGIELSSLPKLFKNFNLPKEEVNEKEKLTCSLLLAAISTKRPLLHCFESYLNRTTACLKLIRKMQAADDLPSSELKTLQSAEQQLLNSHPLIKELEPFIGDLEVLNLNTLAATLLPKVSSDYLSYTKDLLDTLNLQPVDEAPLSRIKVVFSEIITENNSFISCLNKTEIGSIIQHSVDTPLSYLQPLVFLNLLQEMSTKGIEQYFKDLLEARAFYTSLSTQEKAISDDSLKVPPELIVEKVLEVIRQNLAPLLETPRFSTLQDTLVETDVPPSMEDTSFSQAILRPIHLLAHGIEDFNTFYSRLATLIATAMVNFSDAPDLNSYLEKLISSYIKLVISSHLKLDNSLLCLEFNHLLNDEDIASGKVASAYEHFSKHLFPLAILEAADRRLSAALPFEFTLDFS